MKSWLILLAAAAPALSPTPANAGRPATGELHFTFSRYSENVAKVQYDYDGKKTLAISPPTTLLKVPEAYGIVRLPDGDLLIAGRRKDEVYKANLATRKYAAQKNTWDQPYRIAIEPGQKSAYVSDFAGGVVRIPIAPYADGSPVSVNGDDNAITVMTFDQSGNGWYAISRHKDTTRIGSVDHATMTTTRWYTYLPWINAMNWDPFTGHLVMCGDKTVAQFDPETRTLVSERVFLEVTEFNSCVVDGEGHAFVTDWKGFIYFIDYSGSGKIGDTANFVAKPEVTEAVYYMAPLFGPGAPKPKPLPTGPKALYQDRDGNGRIDAAWLEFPKATGKLPASLHLQDPFNPAGGLVAGGERIRRIDITRAWVDFKDREFPPGTAFTSLPQGRILADTLLFHDAPFAIGDGVGPRLQAAEASQPQGRGDRPRLKAVFSEPVKADKASQVFPFELKRGDAILRGLVTVEAVKDLGNHTVEYVFSSPEYPQAGDSLRILPETPLLMDLPGNLPNMVGFVPVSGLPFPVFTQQGGVAPTVVSYLPMPNPKPLANSVLIVDPALGNKCLNCLDAMVESQLAMALQIARPAVPAAGKGFQPHIASLKVQAPLRYDIAFYSNHGAYINRAKGAIDESILARAAKDKDGRATLELHWWPVAEKEACQVRTGAYIARGILSGAPALVAAPGADPGVQLIAPGKTEKVSFVFGYLQR